MRANITFRSLSVMGRWASATGRQHLACHNTAACCQTTGGGMQMDPCWLDVGEGPTGVVVWLNRYT